MDVFVACLILMQTLCLVSPVKSTLLSKRRYLTFPKGSSLSIAICMTAQTGLLPGGIFTEGLNWGIAYDLPGETHPLKTDLKMPTNALRRKHRRDLYERIETILYSIGYDGRSCVLRAICEMQKMSPGKEATVLDKILHIIFSYPLEDIQPSERSEYQSVYNDKLGINDCSELFPTCQFSLIDMALDYYHNQEQWS